MNVVFDEEAYKEIEIEGKGKFIAGGLRISDVPKFTKHTVDDSIFTAERVDPDNLRVGQIIGIKTGEFGQFKKPFVVTERDDDVDDDNDIDQLIRLGFCGSQDVTDGIILTKGNFTDFVASYYDYQWKKGSRFVTSDEFKAVLIPDLILADIFGKKEIKQYVLPYSL